MLWVGLVGPFTNFALMVASAFVARSPVPELRRPTRAPPGPTRSRSRSRGTFALANLFLGVFNLLPIPPLDGSSLLERILPESLAPGLVQVPAVRDAAAVRPDLLHADPRVVDLSARGGPAPIHRLVNLVASRPPVLRSAVAGSARARATRSGRRTCSSPKSCCCTAGYRSTTGATRSRGRPADRWSRSVPTCEKRWIAAAMLHDVGKYDADLSVPGRAVATIVAIAPGRPGAASSGGRRRVGSGPRVALYAQHGELGAERDPPLGRAGGGRDVGRGAPPPRALARARLARRRSSPPSTPPTSSPRPLWRHRGPVWVPKRRQSGIRRSSRRCRRA